METHGKSRSTAMWLALLLSAAAVGGAGMPAASAQSKTPTGLILGRVVDADAGTPVSGVVVTAIGDPSGSAGRPASILTDAEGRFVFRNLATGSYTLMATIGGNGYSPSGFIVTGMGHQIGPYLNGGYGQRRPNGPLQPIDLADGGRIGDAVIRLWKGAAINGRVFDEAGEPLVDMVVSAVRRSTDGRLLTGPTTRTDDRGVYRLGTLAPGQYVIVVPQTQLLMPSSIMESLSSNPPDAAAASRFSSAGVPPPPSGGMRLGTSVAFGADQIRVTNAMLPPQSSVRHVYQSTFHPSVHSAARAVPIVVRSGEERTDVDVQLLPVRAVQVSGTLLDASGPVSTFGVHLMPAETGDGASVLEVATAVTDAGGAFVFPLVPPGNYTLLARRTGVAEPASVASATPPRRPSEMPGAWASQSLSVGDEHVGDVVLTLRPGFQITGRLEFNGASEVPTPDRLKQFSISLAPAQPVFRNSEPLASAPVAASGEFIIRGVAPGRYVMNVRDFPQTWTLQSITAGGRDLTDTVFTIADSEVKDVVVAFTDQPGSLEGTIAGTDAATAERASVFVFPAERTRWSDARATTRSFRTVRVMHGAAFRVTNLLPGDYLVAAASDDLAIDWPDSRFLIRLATAAASVRVEPNRKQSVTLRLATMR